MRNEEHASFPERHELKYFINKGDMIALGHRLGGLMKADAHADERGEYFIRSLYFDDAYNTAYYDKVSGVMGRDKYRIRIYNLSDQVIYLERKRKIGDLIQKSSVRISRKLCEQLMDGNPNSLLKANHPLLSDMYREMRTKLLKPVVLVDYTREVFLLPVENVRITFDKGLKTAVNSTDLFNPNLMTVSPLDDGHEILEVKYDHFLPDTVSALLADTPVIRSAISKYILCRRFEPLG
ncbi:MAG: polyphosphate polymerase domain-containing protein [Clostridia bacterium]|nr:polyphosphate polymerase domain-containing protein [Clostridiales bacterium]MBQ6715619.1 polyphosphate polymerase domain-containing protein [Clostridia bacterium]